MSEVPPDSTRRAANGSPSSRYRIDRLRIRHLRLLQLIDVHRSMGLAARELGVSQPAASLLLRELESVFSATLVTRGPRGAELTKAGHYAVDRIAVVLQSLDMSMQAARAAGAEWPPLRIGCVQVAGLRILPAAYPRMQQLADRPRMQIINGRTVDLIAKLTACELDCVVAWTDEAMAGHPSVAQLDAYPLRSGAMKVIAARDHPLARRRSVHLSDLAHSPWIVPPPPSRTHAAFQRLFTLGGTPVPAVVIECDSLLSTLQLVAESSLLAVAPDAVVNDPGVGGRVVALRGPDLELGRDLLSLFARRENRKLPALRAFLTALQATATIEPVVRQRGARHHAHPSR